MKIDAPFIVGYSKEDNLLWIYNYEDGKEYTIKDDDKYNNILL